MENKKNDMSKETKLIINSVLASKYGSTLVKFEKIFRKELISYCVRHQMLGNNLIDLISMIKENTEGSTEFSPVFWQGPTSSIEDIFNAYKDFVGGWQDDGMHIDEFVDKLVDYVQYIHISKCVEKNFSNALPCLALDEWLRKENFKHEQERKNEIK